MPFVLQHRESGEVFACRLVNHYELAYFGVKSWDEEAEAERERESFLASRGVDATEGWHAVELDEMKLKMCNVKLKNNPSNRVAIDLDGTIRVEKR